MKTTCLKHIRFLFCLSILFVLGCQKEDDDQRQTKSIKQNSISKTISGKDIPEVINFIKSKSNNRMQFLLDDSNSPQGQSRNHEENLSLTNAVTDQIKQVTNSHGKSNYTLNLIEEQTMEGVYFINLVVKEYRDTFYLYIVKYVPDINWLETYRDESDFTSFTGHLYYYSDEGIYLAKVDMQNGASISFERHPCDGDENDNSDSSDSGNNNTGGTGGTSDTGSSDGGDTSDNSNSGNGSGGTGGWNIDLFFSCCWCGGDLVGPHDHVECELTDINNYSSGGFDTNASFSNFLRHPCDNIGGGCAGETDCEYGYDDNCDCLEEPEEGSDVGILINMNEVNTQLNNILDEGDSFVFDLDMNPDDALHFESVADFEEFLDQIDQNNQSFDNDFVEDANNQNAITTEFNFYFEYLSYINVFVQQELGIDQQLFSDYSVENVFTSHTGVVFAITWNQDAWDYSLNSYEVTVNIFGHADLNVIIEGLGVIYSENKHYRVKINATDGSPISGEIID